MANIYIYVDIYIRRSDNVTKPTHALGIDGVLRKLEMGVFAATDAAEILSGSTADGESTWVVNEDATDDDVVNPVKGTFSSFSSASSSILDLTTWTGNADDTWTFELPKKLDSLGWTSFLLFLSVLLFPTIGEEAEEEAFVVVEAIIKGVHCSTPRETDIWHFSRASRGVLSNERERENRGWNPHQEKLTWVEWIFKQAGKREE